MLELVLVSLLLDADEVLGDGLAPMLWVLLPALGVLLAPAPCVLLLPALPALGVVLAPAPCVLLLPALPALGVLPPLLLPEPWATAKPTLPASAAAAARMVKLFLVLFISVLLDMETP